MPRQRTRYNRRTHAFPEDFPERLKRLEEESGLPRPEIAHRLGTYPHTPYGVGPTAACGPTHGT